VSNVVSPTSGVRDAGAEPALTAGRRFKVGFVMFASETFHDRARYVEQRAAA
jgi:hypothetical protein